LILAPHDLAGVHDALRAALRDGALNPDAVDASLARRSFWADWGRAGAGREATLEDVLWARQVGRYGGARRAWRVHEHRARGGRHTVDDDADRALARGFRAAPFLATLRAVGLVRACVDGPTDEGRGAVVISPCVANRRPVAGVRGIPTQRATHCVRSWRSARGASVGGGGALWAAGARRGFPKYPT
jgi:hypothetical protein